VNPQSLSPSKIWVDDIRDPEAFKPGEGWHWCKTITEAIRLLAGWSVEEVHLDHDICHTLPGDSAIVKPVACPEDFTAVAHFIAEMAPKMAPKVVYVHTSSEVGSERIFNILRNKELRLSRVHL
jgi:hypothetical protein